MTFWTFSHAVIKKLGSLELVPYSSVDFLDYRPCMLIKSLFIDKLTSKQLKENSSLLKKT